MGIGATATATTNGAAIRVATTATATRAHQYYHTTMGIVPPTATQHGLLCHASQQSLPGHSTATEMVCQEASSTLLHGKLSLCIVG